MMFPPKISFPSAALFLMIICCLTDFSCCGPFHDEDNSTDTASAGIQRYQVAAFNWKRVAVPLSVSLCLTLAIVANIAFRFFPHFASVFPDSALLIILGLLIGGLFALTDFGQRDAYSITSVLFFLFLLPPIILDAGYCLPPRAFFYNIGTILVYAIIGTLWNAIAIGVCLYLFRQWYSVHIPFLDLMLFASVISAVDSVAVLTVFEEMHVNELLYICVFGESLLNDGVSLVLYNMALSYAAIGSENLIPVDYVAGFLSLFVVSLGGILVGIVWAFLTGLATKHTDHVTVLQPLICLLFPYMAFLCAEMCSLSSILAIITCGLVMKPYIKGNISTNSRITVSYFMKTLSSSAETIIFVFLGLSAVLGLTDSPAVHKYDVDWVFSGVTLVVCFIARFIGVFALTAVVNRFRLQKISFVDQFIMAYGGVRGATAYGLVGSISSAVIPAKGIFVSATTVVILFTVFVQGTTLKPLVKLLDVAVANKDKRTVTEEMFMTVQNYVLAGMEEITGQKGHYWAQHMFSYIDTNFIRPKLMRKVHTHRGRIVRYTKRLREKEAIEKLNAFRKRTVASVADKKEMTKNAILLFHNVVPGTKTDKEDGVNSYSRQLLDEDVANGRKKSLRKRSMFHQEQKQNIEEVAEEGLAVEKDIRRHSLRGTTNESYEMDEATSSVKRRHSVVVAELDTLQPLDTGVLASLSDNDYFKVCGPLQQHPNSDVPVMPVYCVKKTSVAISPSASDLAGMKTTKADIK